MRVKRLVPMMLVLILVVSLCGCDSMDYKKATSLYDEGKFEEAAAIFEKLGDYENSAEMVNVCMYSQAAELFDAGEYEAAQKIFTELGDYADSVSYIQECTYQQALTYFDAGELETAKEIFAGLGDYADSASYVQECTYQQAEELFAAKKYSEAIEAYNTILNYKNSTTKRDAAQREIIYEQYGNVIDLLIGKLWFANGGSDNVLSSFQFTKKSATVTKITHAAASKRSSTAEECPYLLDDTTITIKFANGSERVIPYTINGSDITFGTGDYFTPEEVKADLKGYWCSKESEKFGYIVTKNEYIIFVDEGSFTYEYAAPALLEPDTYYYYGPYDGTFSVGQSGMNTKVSKKLDNEFGFNIIKGKVALLHCDKVCTRTTGFKGENGFSF